MSLSGYLSELVTTAQACGAWPEMRELQTQCEDGFRDTLLRLVRETRQRAIIPYRTERARDKATLDRLTQEVGRLKDELAKLTATTTTTTTEAPTTTEDPR